MARGSAKDGNDALGDGRCTEFAELPGICGATGTLSFPHIALPDGEPPTGYIEVQTDIGIEIWAIENHDPSVECHPQCQPQAMKRVLGSFHQDAVPSACPEPLRNGQERGSKHAGSDPLCMADELPTLVLLLDLLATINLPPA